MPIYKDTNDLSLGKYQFQVFSLPRVSNGRFIYTEENYRFTKNTIIISNKNIIDRKKYLINCVSLQGYQ